MVAHHLRAERRTIHGSWSRHYEPLLTIDSGDRVVLETLDARWHTADRPALGADRPQIAPRHPERDKGHALTGPVAIRGAQPGMTLEVQINNLVTGSWGWCIAGGWPSFVNTGLGLEATETLHSDWSLDHDRQIARNRANGHSLTMRPFLGVMGVAPAEPGYHSTTPPRRIGGNIDCKELVVGSSLYLPIEVEGALFSTGDGHAVQGDGEVSGTAIECPMAVVDLTMVLHAGQRLKQPRAKTPAGWITFGFATDLNAATLSALDDMVDLLTELYGYSRQEALLMASLAADLRITQCVNQVHGVHALLPHGAIR